MEATVSATTNPERRTTTLDMRQKKERGLPISWLTAYDYPTAMAIDRAGLDGILVGDSLGMVVLGYANTLPVTMDEMIHHSKAVARGARRALLVGDMPFLSYQISPAEAVRNAGRFLQEGGMDAVKLEGGESILPPLRAILAAGIPVMGHLGLTPQSIHQLGGYRVQGKTAAAARRLIDDALLLERSGCFSVVLESIPARLADLVSRRLTIPTIGIGAGAGCDGQILVTHDLLGLFDRFTPKFAKKYADLNGEMARALSQYRQDVEQRAFPAPEHTAEMPDTEWHALLADLGDADPGANG
jgi:3-methyl-2-oxobutanoate hydroxymethyltransferase